MTGLLLMLALLLLGSRLLVSWGLASPPLRRLPVNPLREDWEDELSWHHGRVVDFAFALRIDRNLAPCTLTITSAQAPLRHLHGDQPGVSLSSPLNQAFLVSSTDARTAATCMLKPEVQAACRELFAAGLDAIHITPEYLLAFSSFKPEGNGHDLGLKVAKALQRIHSAIATIRPSVRNVSPPSRLLQSIPSAVEIALLCFMVFAVLYPVESLPILQEELSRAFSLAALIAVPLSALWWYAFIRPVKTLSYPPLLKTLRIVALLPILMTASFHSMVSLNYHSEQPAMQQHYQGAVAGYMNEGRQCYALMPVADREEDLRMPVNDYACRMPTGARVSMDVTIHQGVLGFHWLEGEVITDYRRRFGE